MGGARGTRPAGASGRRSDLKKQVSPVVTVVVILVVVVIVALLWNHFGNPKTSGTGVAAGGGAGIKMPKNVDISKVDTKALESVTKHVQEARSKVLDQIKSSAGKKERGD